MSKFRVHVAAEDGHPHLETIEAPTIEEAVSQVRAAGLQLDAITQIDELPPSLEPAELAPPPAPVSYTHLTLPTNREV